jgi:hypothetical protein
MTILNASELAHFDAIAAFVGSAIALTAVCFAPIHPVCDHGSAIAHGNRHRRRPQGPASEELTAPRRSAFRFLWT